MLDLPSVDQELVKLMENRNYVRLVVPLLTHIINKLIREKSYISLSELPKCSSFIVNHINNLPYPENVRHVIDSVGNVSTQSTQGNTMTLIINCAPDFEPREKQSMRDQLFRIFFEWVKLVESPKNPGIIQFNPGSNASLYTFVNEQKRQIIEYLIKECCRTEQQFYEMILIFLESSFEHFSKYGTPGYLLNQNQLFKFVDAFTELVSMLIFSQSDRNRLITMYKSVLNVISQFLIKDHTLQQTNFNKRFYLRILSNMLFHINEHAPQIIQANDNNASTPEEVELSDLNLQLLSLFSDILQSFEPSKLPGKLQICQCARRPLYSYLTRVLFTQPLHEFLILIILC